MKRVIQAELRQQQRERGIPEYARELVARYGYNLNVRKAARNPEELALIEQVQRRKVRHSR